MKLAIGLSDPCDQPQCPAISSLTEYFGQARAVMVSPPAVGTQGLSDPDGPAVVALALALLLGAAAGGLLVYRFAERVERVRDRHRAAAQLRAALAPVLAGFRQAEKEEHLLPLAEALKSSEAQIRTYIDQLSPLTSPSRAERLASRLDELGKLSAAVPAKPEGRTDLAAIRWSLGRLLLNSYF